MEDNYIEVRFDMYCDQCKYADLEEKFEPCNECLKIGARVGTIKPKYFEEDE